MNRFGRKFRAKQKLFEVYFSNRQNGSLGSTRKKILQSHVICLTLNLRRAAKVFFCRCSYFRASAAEEMRKQDGYIGEIKRLMEKLRTPAVIKVF